MFGVAAEAAACARAREGIGSSMRSRRNRKVRTQSVRDDIVPGLWDFAHALSRLRCHCCLAHDR